MKSRNDGEKPSPEEIDPYEDARMRGLCAEGAEEAAREAEKRETRNCHPERAKRVEGEKREARGVP